MHSPENIEDKLCRSKKLAVVMKQHNNSDPTLSCMKKLNHDMLRCNAE